MPESGEMRISVKKKKSEAEPLSDGRPLTVILTSCVRLLHIKYGRIIIVTEEEVVVVDELQV